AKFQSTGCTTVALRSDVARFFRGLPFMILSWLAVALQRERRHQLWRLFWQTDETNAPLILLKLHRRVATMHRHRAHFIQQVSDHDRFARPVIIVRVKSVAFAR